MWGEGWRRLLAHHGFKSLAAWRPGAAEWLKHCLVCGRPLPQEVAVCPVCQRPSGSAAHDGVLILADPEPR